jgi:hypothetical protein
MDKTEVIRSGERWRGSTFMAARPGSNEAARATKASSSATARKLYGSRGSTLYSKLLQQRYSQGRARANEPAQHREPYSLPRGEPS